MFKINYHSLFFFTVLFLNSPNVLCSSFRQPEQSLSPSIPESSVSVPSLFPTERSVTPEPHNWHFNSSTHTFIPIGWNPNSSTSTFANTNHFSLPITHYIGDFSNASANTNNSFPSLIPDDPIPNNTIDTSVHTNYDRDHAPSEKKKKKKKTKKKPTIKKTYRCPKCNKILASLSSLNYHVKTHDPNRPKPFKCHICNKSFVKKSNVTNHIRIHTGVKPFKCDICGKGLSSKNALRNHLNIHRGKKPYKCPECQKGFRQRHSLEEHHKLHKEKKPYKCDQCSKAYATKDGLKYHTKTHSRPKPYMCHYCGAFFALNKEYQYHIRYEEETDDDVKCHICQKGYSNKYILKKHNETIHPGT